MIEPNIDMSLDIELFIEEVKKYPEIWNVAVEEFHDRATKRSAWIDISRTFCDYFDDMDERDKNDICNKLIKKWRNIKDNYLKSIKKKKKYGQSTESSRPYIYTRQLSFLSQAGSAINTRSSVSDEDIDQSQDKNEVNGSESTSPSKYKKLTGKRKRDLDSTSDFTKLPVVTQPVTYVPEPNTDRLFFESLIPSLNDFTEDQRLEFRTEILNIIRRMRRQENVASTSLK